MCACMGYNWLFTALKYSYFPWRRSCNRKKPPENRVRNWIHSRNLLFQVLNSPWRWRTASAPAVTAVQWWMMTALSFLTVATRIFRTSTPAAWQQLMASTRRRMTAVMMGGATLPMCSQRRSSRSRLAGVSGLSLYVYY